MKLSEDLLYPKIETLFDRDPQTFKVDENKVRLPEFLNVKNWFVTEKIDGMNIRITYRTQFFQNVKLSGRVVEIHGRTLKAQIPPFLLDYLKSVFTVEKFISAFPDLEDKDVVVLFGEGYGERIQKGGNYRKGVSFRLFDVKINDWWLEPENISDVASKMGVKTVVSLGTVSLETIVTFVKAKCKSYVAFEDGGNLEFLAEGVVARSYPLMLRRNGERVIFKLKRRDFL